MWSNYHTHSNYCDGKSPLRDLIQKDIISLGFSSHAPLPFDCKWCMQPNQLQPYLTEIDDLKKTTDIELYKGLEVDYIPALTSPAKFADQLDYTIGSIHFVEKFPDGRHWEIDGPHHVFQEGLKEIFHQRVRDAVVRYFELTREMITTSRPTIIGHMDKVKIQNKDKILFTENEPWYREEIMKTVKQIADAGCIVEVNTRGVYQGKSLTPYPSPWILELLLEKNVPVTVSSDAHHPDDLINHFQETAALLSSIGFKKISILKDHRWVATEFNEHGIIIH